MLTDFVMERKTHWGNIKLFFCTQMLLRDNDIKPTIYEFHLLASCIPDSEGKAFTIDVQIQNDYDLDRSIMKLHDVCSLIAYS